MFKLRSIAELRAFYGSNPMLVGCESGSLALKQGGKNSLLGLGLLIRPPAESLLQVLWAANSVLEDVFNHVLNTAQQVGAILETSLPQST